MAQLRCTGIKTVCKLTVIGLACLGWFAADSVNADSTVPQRHYLNDSSYDTAPPSDNRLDALQRQLASVRAAAAEAQSTPSEKTAFPMTPRSSSKADARLDRLVEELQALETVEVEIPLHYNSQFAQLVDEEGELLETAPEVELGEDAPLIDDEDGVDSAEVDERAPEEPITEPTEEPITEPTEEAVIPTPPAPREAPPTPITVEANREVAERLREIQRGESIGGVLDGDAAEMLQVTERRPYTGDPMQQPVTIDFRDMELSNVVALLAHKADINVIAGIDLQGTVTANLREVPLQQAMEMALRMNGLGLMEEDGIYHIVSYQEAQAARRKTVMVHLKDAQAQDIQSVLNDIAAASPERGNISVTANQHANLLIISGPERRINELAELAESLDVTEAAPPTVTEIIFVNHSEPDELVPIVESMMLSSVGEITADERGRQLIIKDLPVVVEQVRKFVQDVDIAVKQVNIDAMVLDVVLDDGASTGVDWMVNVIRRQSPYEPDRFVGNLQELVFDTENLNIGSPTGAISFGLLTRRLDWRGIIQAELQSSNTHLVSNPSVITLDGKPASITISQEIPYVELTQTDAGGNQTSTQFKDIGTILEVTPHVTHEDQIIADIVGKESNTAGVFNNIPIEEKREIETSTRVHSGQTIFIGGLRKNSDTTTVRKIPVLGDIPIINPLFRQNIRNESATELLIFLTCTVVDDDIELTDYQLGRVDLGEAAEMRVNSAETVYRDIIDPSQSGDPTRGIRRNSQGN